MVVPLLVFHAAIDVIRTHVLFLANNKIKTIQKEQAHTETYRLLKNQKRRNTLNVC